MARTVEGVFRSQAQAEKALQELKERGLDRDVALAPSGTSEVRPEGLGQTVLPAGLSGGGGGALGMSRADWFQAPYHIQVTTSASRAPEVAQVLRRYGAEDVDMT